MGRERGLGAEGIRERLRGALDRARPVALEGPSHERGMHKDWEHRDEPEPINTRLRALLARKRPAAEPRGERHGPVARVVERA